MASIFAIGRRTVFAVSLAVYVVFGLWSVTANGLGGDEPHYLVITESLLRDGDLQIENNHLRGDYRPFFPANCVRLHAARSERADLLDPCTRTPGDVVPGYAVFGYLGAVAFIAFLAALAWRSSTWTIAWWRCGGNDMAWRLP
jgi:hypothetical protein